MNSKRENVYKYYPDLNTTQRVRRLSIPAWGLGRKNYSDFNAALSHVSSMVHFHNNIVNSPPTGLESCSLFETPVLYKYNFSESIFSKVVTYSGEEVTPVVIDSFYDLMKEDPSLHMNMTELTTFTRYGDRYPVIRYDATAREYNFIQYDDTSAVVDKFDFLMDNLNKQAIKSIDVLDKQYKTLNVNSDIPRFITAIQNTRFITLSKDGSSVPSMNDYFEYKQSDKYYNDLDKNNDGYISQSDIDLFQSEIGNTVDYFGEELFNILDINQNGTFDQDDFDNLSNYVGQVNKKGWYLVPNGAGIYEIEYYSGNIHFVYNQDGSSLYYRGINSKRIYLDEKSSTFFELIGNNIIMYKTDQDTGERAATIDLTPYVIGSESFPDICDFDIQDNRLYCLYKTETTSNTYLYVSCINYTTYEKVYSRLIDDTHTAGYYTNANLFAFPDQSLVLYLNNILYRLDPVWTQYYHEGNDYYFMSKLDIPDADPLFLKVWTNLDFYAAIYGIERFADESLYEYYYRIVRFIELKEDNFINVLNVYYQMPVDEKNIVAIIPTSIEVGDAVNDLTVSVGGNSFEIVVDSEHDLYINSNYSGYIRNSTLVLYDTISQYYSVPRLVSVNIRSLNYDIQYNVPYRLKVFKYKAATTSQLTTMDLSYFKGKGKFLSSIINDIYSSINTYGNIRPYESSYDVFDFGQYGNYRIQTEWN